MAANSYGIYSGSDQNVLQLWCWSYSFVNTLHIIELFNVKWVSCRLCELYSIKAVTKSDVSE